MSGAPRRGLSDSVRFEILKRDKFTCRYCGRSAPAVELHVDHIHPFSKGGTDVHENLCAACVQCNLSKRAELITNHLPRPADDAPLAERVAHLKLELKRRFRGYEPIQEWVFTELLDGNVCCSLSDLIGWLDHDVNRDSRFVSVAVALAEMAVKTRNRKSWEADEVADSASWLEKIRWGEALGKEFRAAVSSADVSLLADPASGCWDVHLSHLLVECAIETDCSAIYAAIRYVLSRGVGRGRLLSAIAAGAGEHHFDIFCMISAMLREIDEAPTPDVFLRAPELPEPDDGVDYVAIGKAFLEKLQAKSRERGAN